MHSFKAKVASLQAKIKSVDINGNFKYFSLAPLVVILVMIICGLCYQFTNTRFDKFANIGVDFQGGTMLTVELQGGSNLNSGDNYKKYMAEIEKVLKEEGFKVAVDQSSGDTSIVVRYLNTRTNPTTGQLEDYNGDEKVSEMNEINENIKAKVTDNIDKVGNGVTVKTSTATLIGNSASIKLINTALLSVGIALIVMLIYIFIRFDFYSAMAAIVALVHDVAMMLAFAVIFYVEINSTIVAGIITIIAYSINNTIIVFDRIRSDIQPYKKTSKKFDEALIVNGAIHGTMRRTLYTTITTLITITLLAVVGVTSIQVFALPIIFGLIGGFYSSVFLAAPLWGVFKSWGEKIKIKKANKKFKKK